MKTIELSRGKVAIVDDLDYEWLSKYKWHVNNYGYAVGRMVAGKKVMMHRAIMNPPDNKQIDHINHNTLDNRRENLRICTRSNNQMNRGLQSNSTTGYKGVCFDKYKQRFISYLKLNGKQIRFGYCHTPEEAARRYNKAALEMFGEFAMLNDLENQEVSRCQT